MACLFIILIGLSYYRASFPIKIIPKMVSYSFYFCHILSDCKLDWVWDYAASSSIGRVNTTLGWKEYTEMKEHAEQVTGMKFKLLCGTMFLDDYQWAQSRIRSKCYLLPLHKCRRGMYKCIFYMLGTNCHLFRHVQNMSFALCQMELHSMKWLEKLLWNQGKGWRRELLCYHLSQIKKRDSLALYLQC